MIVNERLNKINLALHNLERQYDKQEIDTKEYHKLHKRLMERKSLIIDKILGDKNE